jgi:hypothetical protein
MKEESDLFSDAEGNTGGDPCPHVPFIGTAFVARAASILATGDGYGRAVKCGTIIPG